jgi:hypothetical protein
MSDTSFLFEIFASRRPSPQQDFPVLSYPNLHADTIGCMNNNSDDKAEDDSTTSTFMPPKCPNLQFYNIDVELTRQLLWGVYIGKAMRATKTSISICRNLKTCSSPPQHHKKCIGLQHLLGKTKLPAPYVTTMKSWKTPKQICHLHGHT